jgi:beta-galactosidase
MPTISFDGQSLIIGTQRVWLVSGSLHYFRIPHELWPQRLAAAKQAGLNCITTCVAWNVHEPEPGQFHFEGDADLRRFVQLIGEAGMYCILGPGPYIGAEWDFGGLPAWLNRIEGVQLRQANPAYIEACTRYLGQVMGQVKDLQVTGSSSITDRPVEVVVARPGARGSGRRTPSEAAAATTTAEPSGGGIVMVQAENQWYCHNPDQIGKYLGELTRYLRENGCTVPISMCNNLWATVDGTIATWNANEHLAADLRQLSVVQPNAPRFVSAYWPGRCAHWGGKHEERFDAGQISHHLAQILASGAQYNLYMFHGGTSFGFYAGRSDAGPDRFTTTSYDYGAPLLEAGGRGDKFLAVKRISTFASQFANIFAHLEPGRGHVAVAPVEVGAGLSVIHQHGGQGQVVFLLKGPQDQTTQLDMLLPNGLTLPVPIGSDRVAWFVIDANLAGVAQLTYTNLRPWAFLGNRMLVLFGPAGAEGLICINDALLSIEVPTGRTPGVALHEDLTIVILNAEQVDAAYPTDTGLVIGAAGLAEDDAPLPHADWPQVQSIEFDGQIRRRRMTSPQRHSAPRLGNWKHAAVTEMIDGSSASFTPIDGPASLETLKCNFGYGWYRLSLRNPVDANLLTPGSADRLHLFDGGVLRTLLGRAPGAQRGPCHLKLTEQITLLADNLGRSGCNGGLTERKGLFDHLYDVAAFELGVPQVIAGRAPDLFELGGFFATTRRDDRPPADALLWQLEGMRNGVMVLELEGFEAAAMLLVNDQPIGVYDPQLTSGTGRFTLEAGKQFGRGVTRIQLALFEPFDAQRHTLARIKLYQSSEKLTSRAAWAFAPWTPPQAEAFGPMPKLATSLPCWYRTQFKVSHTDAPLWFEIPTAGSLSKGQIYLNGHNLGRYFAATQAGQPVGPQTRYYLPEPWLHSDSPNELLIFEEHGNKPAKCKLIYDPMGPPRL